MFNLTAIPRPALTILAIAFSLLGACGALTPDLAHAQQQPQQPQPPDMPPPAPREFRGLWVASIGNGGWPSRPGLSVAEQKQQMLRILDGAAAHNLNAIVLQVRPCADALYESKLEPWSEYLTGVQGQPPTPLYDPLAVWIEEAHKRGIELHAWFNPYRVKHANSQNPDQIAANSVARTRPDIVRRYGGYLWMDPGEPLAAQHTLDVILDIVRRYDVDGVHTDDYYYPYPAQDEKTGTPLEFPDQRSYDRYRRAGGTLPRDDWRRDNISQFVRRVYVEVKDAKPWVKVSYGPFGIWKSGTPPGIKGMSQFDALFADAKLWLNHGWLDFIAPQLYWKIGGEQDFVALLKWWVNENAQQRHVWPGISIAKHPPGENLLQIQTTRQIVAPAPGQMLWGAHAFFAEDQKPLRDALRTGPYAHEALPPAFPWLDKTPPPAPTATLQRTPSGAGVTVTLRPGAGEPALLYAVWARYGTQYHFTAIPAGAPSLTLNADAAGNPPNAVVITSVDRCGNESARVALTVR